jgi:hypothetical protein
MTAATAQVQRSIAELGADPTNKQLKAIEDVLPKVKQACVPVWTTLGIEGQASRTACLKVAVQILYAEGIEGEMGEKARKFFAPLCLQALNSIVAGNFQGIKTKGAVYTTAEVTRVLEAMYRAIANIRGLGAGLTGLVPINIKRLEGLSALTGGTWLMPIIHERPVTTARANAEEYLGAVQGEFNPHSLLRLENETMSVLSTPSRTTPKVDVHIKSYLTARLTVACSQFSPYALSLIRAYVGDIEGAWNLTLINETYSITSGGQHKLAASELGTMISQLTTEIRKFGSPFSIPNGDWVARDEYGLVAHVTLMRPVTEVLFVWRAKATPVIYPAFRKEGLEDGRIAIVSKGIEALEYSYGNRLMPMINGKAAIGSAYRVPIKEK